MSLYITKKRIETLKKDILVVIILFLLSYFSYIFSINVYDFHHVGLLFTNAEQFIQGKILYKEISEFYGVFFTVLGALGLSVFGNNFFSLYLICLIFFFIGNFFLYKIFFKISGNYFNSLLLIILLIFINPIIILPWPNFLAFLTIVLSCYFLINFESKKKFFFSGLFLGVSILIRENNLIPASLILIYIFFFVFFVEKDKKLFFYFFLGLITPLSIFIFYIYTFDLFFYWKIFSFDLLKLFSKYENKFSHVNHLLSIFRPLLGNLFLSLKNNDFRWFLYLIIFFLNIYFLNNAFYQLLKKNNSRNLFVKSVLSIYSLSFAFNSVHAAEIFRLSTGSIIGICLLSFFNKNLIRYFLIIFIVLIGFQFDKYKSLSDLEMKSYNIFNKNFFYKTNNKPYFLANQNYPQEVYDFFNILDLDCKNLRGNLNIVYFSNYTNNSVIGHVCQLQRSHTFPQKFINEEFDNIRANLEAKSNLLKGQKSAIFILSENMYLLDQNLKKKYRIYKKYKLSDELLKAFPTTVKKNKNTPQYFLILIPN